MHVLEVLDALLALGTGRRFSVREAFEEEKLRTLRPAAGSPPPLEAR
jgi:hypothetical protein